MTRTLLSLIIGISFFSPSAQARECELTGKETHAIKVDGVLLGVADAVEYEENQIRIRGGLFFYRAFLSNWIARESTQPEVAEMHDITLVLLNGARLTLFQTEAINAKIVSHDVEPSELRPGCLIIRDLVFDADQVTHEIAGPN